MRHRRALQEALLLARHSRFPHTPLKTTGSGSDPGITHGFVPTTGIFRVPVRAFSAGFPSAYGPEDPRHLYGLPRRAVLSSVGSIAWFYMNVLNRMEVKNQEILKELVHNRPPGTPLITVSNHMST